MEGMPPALYCGIVDAATGECVNVGVAFPPWGEAIEFDPSPQAYEEFAAIAAAAYPERPSGFVNVWVEVIP